MERDHLSVTFERYACLRADIPSAVGKDGCHSAATDLMREEERRNVARDGVTGAERTTLTFRYPAECKHIHIRFAFVYDADVIKTQK